MEPKERYSEIGSGHLGVGCLVAPAALIGTAMILDYPGPPGPFGFAEFFGWWAVCLFVAVSSAGLADRWRNVEPRHHRLLLASLALPVCLTGLLILEIRPTTPDRVKDFVEYSLQAIGLLTICLTMGWLCWNGWRSRRR